MLSFQVRDVSLNVTSAHRVNESVSSVTHETAALFACLISSGAPALGHTHLRSSSGPGPGLWACV